jgi:hypothetical protein
MKLPGFRRDLVDLHLIDAIVHRAQILVVRRRYHAADMRTEVPFCHRTDALMKYTVHDRTQPAVPVRVHDGNLPVVVTADKQKLSGNIR